MDGYTYIHTRRNGTKLFGDDGHAHFARIGPLSILSKEMEANRFLASLGCPVPEIIDAQVSNGQLTIMEKSVGSANCAQIFEATIDQKDKARCLVLQSTLVLVRSFLSSLRSIGKVKPFNDLNFTSIILKTYAGCKSADLLVELCDCSESAGTYVHGDLTLHNLTPTGVFDFENFAFGPQGYDEASLLSAPSWFPSRNAEIMRTYSFTEKELRFIFAELYPAQDIVAFKPLFQGLLLQRFGFMLTDIGMLPNLFGVRVRALQLFVENLSKYRDCIETVIGLSEIMDFCGDRHVTAQV